MPSSANPPRVGATIEDSIVFRSSGERSSSVEYAFVVSSRNQRRVPFSVGQQNKGKFFAGKRLFKKDTLPPGPELLPDHNAFDEVPCFAFLGRHQDALAGAQPVRLDDQGPFHLSQSGAGFFRALVGSVHLRRGDAVPLQEFLRENLAAFELRRNLRGPENWEAPRSKRVTDSVDEWQLRSHNRQVRTTFLGQFNQSRRVSRIHADAFGFLGNPAVAGRAPDLFYSWALPQLPHQSVLAPAASDHQNFHSVCSFSTQRQDSRRRDGCQHRAQEVRGFATRRERRA